MDKQQKAGTKVATNTSDSTLNDLQERYNMDESIWQASKRGFPFNVPFNFIVALALGPPLILTYFAFDFKNHYLWKCYFFTLALSTAAYFISDRMIDQFKESLEKNGLFGKDLNKAGQRDTKPPV
jgi:hypothetical protein